MRLHHVLLLQEQNRAKIGRLVEDVRDVAEYRADATCERGRKAAALVADLLEAFWAFYVAQQENKEIECPSCSKTSTVTR